MGIPRIIAIAVLNGFKMHAFDDLPVVRFAADEKDKGLLTPQYSFALAQNFSLSAITRQTFEPLGNPFE